MATIASATLHLPLTTNECRKMKSRLPVCLGCKPARMCVCQHSTADAYLRVQRLHAYARLHGIPETYARPSDVGTQTDLMELQLHICHVGDAHSSQSIGRVASIH